MDEAVGDLVGEVGYHVECRGVAVFYSIHDDSGEACILSDFAAVVVSAPVHLYAALLEQRGQFVGLLDGVVGGMSLRVIALEEVSVGEDDGVAEGMVSG